MKNRKQFECEALIWFVADGKREQRWIRRAVVDIMNGTRVRCHKCKEPMRIHRQRKAAGPRDHVEHVVQIEKCNPRQSLCLNKVQYLTAGGYRLQSFVSQYRSSESFAKPKRIAKKANNDIPIGLPITIQILI